MIERLAVLAVFRNRVQGVSERRFPTRIPLGPSASRVYRRRMGDPRGITWPPQIRQRAL